MNVIDKEQERKEFENTPEGKKKKMQKNLLYAIGVIVLFAGVYFINHSPSIIGEPHNVEIASITIEPGKTTVADLINQGFYISENIASTKIDGYNVKSEYDKVYNPSTPVDANSYYDLLTLAKNTQGYAKLTVVNESSTKKTLSDCKVRELTLHKDIADFSNSSVDGIAMGQLTVDALSEKIGEADSVSDSTDSSNNKVTNYKWEKGYYSLKLTVSEDGSIDRFTSSYENEN